MILVDAIEGAARVSGRVATSIAQIRLITPGVLALAAIAGLARGLGLLLPNTISEVFIALLIGLAIFNTIGSPVAVAPGARFGMRTLLRAGIVLLGARLSFEGVLAVGVQSLLFVLAAFVVGGAAALLVAFRLGLTRQLAILLAVGTAICGNSAIIAASPIIRARQGDVTYAVATITLFGTLAVLVYPFVGHALDVPQAAFGAWAGTAVNDTAQVVATGYAYGPEAGDVATVVKLTRNLLIGPVLIALAIWSAAVDGDSRGGGRRWSLTTLRTAVPLFVLGFVAMAALNTAGLFNDQAVGLARQSGTFLISMAIAGVGLNTSLAGLRSTGPRPLLTGLLASLVLAAFSMSAVLLFWR